MKSAKYLKPSDEKFKQIVTYYLQTGCQLSDIVAKFNVTIAVAHRVTDYALDEIKKPGESLHRA